MTGVQTCALPISAQRQALVVAFGIALCETRNRSCSGHDEIVGALGSLQTTVLHHIDIKAFEQTAAAHKADADMLFKLGGVMLCILAIAIGSARLLGLVY